MTNSLEQTRIEVAENGSCKSKATGRVWCGPEVKNIDKLVAEWKSLGHYLLHKMTNDNANDTIVTDFASGRQYTGLQLKDKVLAVACALIDGYNFEPGTMVCVAYDNSDHLLILALAVLVAGGSICCGYYKDPYAELLYLAKKVDPKFLFCHSKNLHWAQQLSADLGTQVVGLAMDGSKSNSNKPPFSCFADLISYDYQAESKSLNKLPVATVKPLDKQVALITMSSGTTGRPKAVSQSHWNCIADLMTMRRTNYKNFAFACAASLDYVSGRLIMLGAINGGYNAVILNGFEPKTYLTALEQYKVEIVYLGAASFYNLITYKDIDQFDLSSIKLVFPMGARIIYLDELREFFAKHPNIVQVRQGFGASELSGACLNSMTPEEYLRDCNNCGRLLPGMRAKIVDPKTGRLLGPNEEGILHLRGPTVFPGYYDMEQYKQASRKVVELNGNETDDASVFVRDETVFDSEGYYITGDLAYFTDKEQLYVIGRQKELMTCRSGKKVLPQELEELISSHPAVLKVCVLGIPNKRELTLHCPRAFVVVKPEYYDINDGHQPSDHDSVLTSRIKSMTLDKDLEGQPEAEQLEHVGNHKLCKMATERRRLISEDLMRFVDERVGWEKQLTGGIVVLDDIPTSRATGKMNKNYLRSLDYNSVEIYGDRSERVEA